MIAITLEITLPCGCAAKHRVCHEYDPEPPSPGFMKVDFNGPTSMSPDRLIQRFGEHSTQLLAYWYQVHFIKENRHRCELVSEDNPMGLIPKR